MFTFQYNPLATVVVTFLQPWEKIKKLTKLLFELRASNALSENKKK